MYTLFDHWFIQTATGALIGFLLPYFIKVIVTLIKRFRKTNICGAWYTYSFIMENNNPMILKGNMRVSRGTIHPYKVVVNENELHYHGNLQIENNHLLFLLKSNDGIRTETSHIRIDRSSYAKRNTLYGYWLSYDSDNKLSCGTFIMSRVLLEIDGLEQGTNCLSKHYYNNAISRIEY